MSTVAPQVGTDRGRRRAEQPRGARPGRRRVPRLVTWPPARCSPAAGSVVPVDVVGTHLVVEVVEVVGVGAGRGERA